MANQTRMHDTSSPSRFGRTSGRSPGRSASGRPASAGKGGLRAKQGEVGAKGRFGLGSSLGPSGYGRSSRSSSGRSTGTSTGMVRRPKRNVTPEKSGMSKALSAFGSLSGGKAAKKVPSRSAKPAGFALLAGAAGLVLKNREKIMGLANRGGSSREGAPSGTVYGDGTATGVRVDNGMPASAIGVTEGQVPGSDRIDNPTSDQRLTD